MWLIFEHSVWTKSPHKLLVRTLPLDVDIQVILAEMFDLRGRGRFLSAEIWVLNGQEPVRVVGMPYDYSTLKYFRDGDESIVCAFSPADADILFHNLHGQAHASDIYPWTQVSTDMVPLDIQTSPMTRGIFHPPDDELDG